MKRFIVMISCGALLLSGVAVYAATAPSSATPRPREEVKGEVQKLRVENRASTTQQKEQFQEKRNELKADIQNASTTQEKSALRQEIEKTRQDLMQKIKTQKETLLTQVKKIKDTQKQETVVSVQDALTNLNEKVTNQLLVVTEKLETILGNISSRTAKTKVGGVNVATVETAIQTATNAIQTSKDAIKAQAGKTYSITISGTGTAVQADVVKARQSLMTDLSATRVVVQKARETVQQAATTLAQIVKSTTTSTATSTQ